MLGCAGFRLRRDWWLVHDSARHRGMVFRNSLSSADSGGGCATFCGIAISAGPSWAVRLPRIKKRRYGSSISSLKRVGDETKSGASIFPKAPGSSNLMWVRPVLLVCLAQVFPVRQGRGAYRARQGRPAFSDLRAIRLRTQGKPCRRSLPQRRIRGIFS